jgi:hypothetical protein
MKPNKDKKLKVVTFTIQEIWAASKTKVFKNKKKYSRKNNKGSKDSFYYSC